MVVDLGSTYVFVLGDNGTPATAARVGVQDPRRMKATTYEDGVNVPLVVVGPGVAPSVTGALGHVVDLMATTAGLAHAALPGATDSVSLAPVLFDPQATVRAHLVCDYVAPVRGESSRTRRALERRGIELPRHRDTAIVMRDERAVSLVKGRWVVELETGEVRMELRVLEDGTFVEDGRAPDPGTRARLEELYGAYLGLHPAPGH